MQFDELRRREFITLLGGAAAAWPLAARAQQPAKLPTIGYLGTAAASAWAPWTAAFVQRLHELGWIDELVSAVSDHCRCKHVAEVVVQLASWLMRVVPDLRLRD
jgi:hypothetical protein